MTRLIKPWSSLCLFFGQDESASSACRAPESFLWLFIALSIWNELSGWVVVSPTRRRADRLQVIGHVENAGFSGNGLNETRNLESTSQVNVNDSHERRTQHGNDDISFGQSPRSILGEYKLSDQLTAEDIQALTRFVLLGLA
jgi:hypothetical protein